MSAERLAAIRQKNWYTVEDVAYLLELLDQREKSGVGLITAERQRQIEKEGWTPEHDAEHSRCELAKASECYLREYQHPVFRLPEGSPLDWPWNASWWKPSDDPIRNLVKAGALIAAEIDRLQRLAGVPQEDKQ